MSFVLVAEDQVAEETAATPVAVAVAVRPTLSQQFI
jgi:hypothetical protein